MFGTSDANDVICARADSTTNTFKVLHEQIVGSNICIGVTTSTYNYNSGGGFYSTILSGCQWSTQTTSTSACGSCTTSYPIMNSWPLLEISSTSLIIGLGSQSPVTLIAFQTSPCPYNFQSISQSDPLLSEFYSYPTTTTTTLSTTTTTTTSKIYSAAAKITNSSNIIIIMLLALIAYI